MKYASILLLFIATSCAERDPLPTPCETANGEWVYQSSPEIYLNFNDGELLTGTRIAGDVTIYETYDYSCECDTLRLANRATGFTNYLTFWRISDTTALLNGPLYPHPETLIKI